MDAKELAKICVDALEDKKGIDIKTIDISHISIMADYFVIASGNSNKQVQALVDNVTDECAKNKISPKQIEGYNSGNWVLLDFGDVIVHVFDKDNRLFYDLERIWQDGKIVTF